MIYLKNSLVFESLNTTSDNGTEIISIRVKVGRRRWATIHNLYCPPKRPQSSVKVILTLDNIPVSPETLVLGDFNAHTRLWDEHQPTDDRGDMLLDWCLSKNLHIMNDGTHTRVNTRSALNKPSPASEGKSAPDVSICGTYWSSKFTWRTSEAIGSSDHDPIEITLNEKISLQPIFKGIPRWKTKGVDWAKFTSEVDEQLDKMPDHTNVHRMAKDLEDVIIQTAQKFVGTTTPGKGRKPWITPEVKEAIKLRNKLRKNISKNREEWLAACKAAREAIIEAQENEWRKVLEDASESHNDTKLWKTIKSLNGTPDQSSPNEAMIYQDRTITSNKQKANIFMRHYTNIGRLRTTKKDRAENRLAKAALRNLKPNNPNPFTMIELQIALKNTKARSSPGPDKISPNLLKHLGPKALQKLLDLFNLSLKTATTPQSWKNATIVPILKPNKPPSCLDSYRPISLTSCIAKLFERILSERLYDHGEREGLFSSAQAGFRRGRGVEDQVLRVSQAISDALERGEHSILALLDFSKAYDRIWRQRLILSLLNIGIPDAYVAWLGSFLDNRQARVRFNGEISKSGKIPQGLPQGSVLAPVLFLLYINHLTETLPANITTCMYADDVSILASGKSTSETQSRVQNAVDATANWSDNWKLALNASKSEVIAFKLKSSWKPSITLNNNQIPSVSHTKFLGITYDSQLNFNKHVEDISARVARKMKILAAVAHSSWGWRKRDLKKVYVASIQSILDYAGSGWQPWLSDCQIQKLQRLQNKCLRLITSQAKSSPTEALRAETGIQSIRTSIQVSCLRSREKALRLPLDHPRRLAFEGETQNRLKKPNAKKLAKKLISKIPDLPNLERAPLQYFTVRPWARGIRHKVFPMLEGIRGRTDQTEDITSAALSRARDLNSVYNIYTDGSASAGTSNGGAAAVITVGDPAKPTVVQTIQARGAKLTCSFAEEHQAMHMAADWLIENNISTSVAIFTDSQSLCIALEKLSPGVEALSAKLNGITAPITIQWIPGHSNVPGNELADAAAKAATEQPGAARGVSFSSACAAIKRCIKDPNIQHHRTAQIYASLSEKNERKIKSRSDQSLLAKLRSGHYRGLRAYKNRIDGGLTDPKCPHCDEDALHNIEHWVQCPALAHIRRSLIGEDYRGLDLLTKFPLEAIALARATIP